MPTLTWLLLLKFVDDERVLDGAPLLTLEPPYRWRDWARGALDDEELLAFVKLKNARRPDGSRGTGLFEFLRNLAPERDSFGVLRSVFTDVDCRATSGAVMAEVARQIDSLTISTADDVHVLATLYESMIQELRDAAGDSGEFYTPRPLIRAMVELICPSPGEYVLDPVCGTGGFLRSLLLRAWI